MFSYVNEYVHRAFYNCHLRRWIDGELELAFFPVVHGEALHEQGCEAGTSSSTEGVENEESLQTSALVGQFPDSVEN